MYSAGKQSTRRNVILPKIDNGRSSNHHSGSGHHRIKKRQIFGGGTTDHQIKSTYDPSCPLTLELKHGGQKHRVSLPTENLDKSKKYYVTFTINNRGRGNKISRDSSQFEEEEEAEEEQKDQIHQINPNDENHQQHRNVIPQEVESR
jgi:hypothetical protein